MQEVTAAAVALHTRLDEFDRSGELSLVFERAALDEERVLWETIRDAGLDAAHVPIEALTASARLHGTRFGLLASDPAQPEVHAALGFYDLIEGREPDAVPEQMRALLLQLRPGEVAPDASTYLDLFARCLHRRFEITGFPADLDAAIICLRGMLQAAPTDHPGLAAGYLRLGNFLAGRHETSQAVSDIEDAVESHGRAVSLTSLDDPQLVKLLQDWHALVYSWFELAHDAGGLHAAVAFSRQIVEAMPAETPRLYILFQHLGALSNACYMTTGELADLDETAEFARRAVELLPPDHSEPIGVVLNWMITAHVQSTTQPDADRLSATIAFAHDVVDGVPTGDERLAAVFHILGMLHRMRHDASSDGTADLEAAVELLRRAVVLTPLDGAELGNRLCTWQSAVHARYFATEDVDELTAAIAFCQYVIESAPAEASHLRAAHDNLGVLCGALYDGTGDPADLDATIAVIEEALAGRRQDPDSAARWTLLGERRLSRFVFGRNADDLTAAIEACRRAVSLAAEDEELRADCRKRLDEALEARILLGWVPSIIRVSEPARRESGPDPAPTGPAAPGAGAQRGIVICGEVRSTVQGGFSFSEPDADLRSLTLYWDQIALAYGNSVGYLPDEPGMRLITGSGTDLRLLEQAGVLRMMLRDIDHPMWKPGGPAMDHGRVVGIPGAHHIRLTAARARLVAMELNGEPGSFDYSWSVGRTLQHTRPAASPRTTPGADERALELMLSLPVPPADVPLERIIAFRERHETALLAMRRGIRSLVQVREADVAALLGEINTAVREIDRYLAESFVQRWARRTSVVLGLQNLAQSAVIGVVGELLGRSLHLPEGVGPALGIAASGVLQVAQKQVPPEYLLPDRIADFYYVYGAARLARD